jgi:sugar lactone lactonase YvrE
MFVTLMFAGCGGSGGSGGSGTVQMGGAIQGNTLSLTGAVSTIAGTANTADGTGETARFCSPHGVASDGTNLYVVDSEKHTIRKIVISTGVVTTLAGSAGIPGSNDGTGTAARFDYPRGIATDGTNLYVADSGNSTIRKIIISTGVVTTLAGAAGIQGSTDGSGAAARFTWPMGLATDGTSLFVADTGNNTVRKIIISSGVVSTIAGSAGNSGSTDGIGTAALFGHPIGVATDRTNLYVTDTGNQMIRKIEIATGVVSTLAGVAQFQGSEDGIGSAARFSLPQGITVHGTNLYVADTGNRSIRKIVISTGAVTTLSQIDDSGSPASLNSPQDISTDGTDLFVTEGGSNKRIVKIAIVTSTLSTLAGFPDYIDGTGASASFSGPYGITTDGINLYVTDLDNSTIRKIVIATGVVTTVAGTAGNSGAQDGTGSAASFNGPSGITTDGANLYVADFGSNIIRKIVISTGAVTTVAGSAYNSGAQDGTGAAASFYFPTGITTDGSNLYVADTGNRAIRKIVISTGAVTTLAGSAGIPGADDGAGTSARFCWPDDITTDGENLYVVDSGNEIIRKIVISTGAVTTLAGTAGISGAVDATGAAASFSFPSGITTDGTNLYVTETSNNTIRKIVISTGDVTTLAGTVGIPGSVDGIGDAASFSLPYGITTDGASLYVADYYNFTIRKLQ